MEKLYKGLLLFCLTFISLGVFAQGPTVTVSGPTTTNQNFTATFTFSEAVTGFTEGDISVINGSVVSGTLATSNSITYTAQINPIGDPVQVSIPAGVAQNSVPETNQASNTLSVTYDAPVAPTEVPVLTATNITNGSVRINWDWSGASDVAENTLIVVTTVADIFEFFYPGFDPLDGIVPSSRRFFDPTMTAFNLYNDIDDFDDGVSHVAYAGLSTTGFVDISNLDQNQEYFVMSYAYNGGEGTSLFFSDFSPISFITEPGVETPILDNISLVSVGSDEVTVDVSIFSSEGANLIERGTEYSLATDAVGNALTEGGTDLGNFIQTRTGLTPATRYYIRGYADNGTFTGYSPILSFVTLEVEPDAHVIDLTALNPTTTSIDLEFNSAGINSVQGYIILYNTTGGALSDLPQDAVIYNANDAIGGSTVAGFVNHSNGLENFSVTGLATGVTYTFYVVPYSQAVGEPESINYFTDPVIPSVTETTLNLAPEPDNHVIDLIATVPVAPDGYTQIDLEFNSTGINDVTEYMVLYNTSGNVLTVEPTDGIAYTAGATIGDAIVAGFVTHSNGVENFSVTGLDPGTLYNFFIVPLNTLGTDESINYRTVATIPTVAETTLDIAPEPDADVTSVVATTAASPNNFTQIDITWDYLGDLALVEGFIILRTNGIDAPDTPPVDGVAYSANDALGNAIVQTVITDDLIRAFSATGLTPDTQYTFTIYPYNNESGFAISTNYRIDNPGFDEATTDAINSYVWEGDESTDWTVAGNWSPARNTPLPDDFLIFNIDSDSKTVTNIPTETVSAITMSDSHTFNAGTTGNVLTIAGSPVLGDDFILTSGTTLTVNSANALDIVLASGSMPQVSGNITLTGGTHQFINNSGNTITFGSGQTVTIGTGMGTEFPFGTAPNNAFVFASGSIYNHNDGSSPFGGPGNEVVTYEAGSIYNRTNGLGSNFSLANRTYGFVNLSGTFINTNNSDGVTTILNNLTVNTPTAFNGNAQIILLGDFLGTANITINGNNFRLEGLTNQQINRNIGATSGLGRITINNASGITLGINVSTGALLTMTQGDINLNGFSMTLSTENALTYTSGFIYGGNLTRNLPGTYTIGSYNTGLFPLAMPNKPEENAFMNIVRTGGTAGNFTVAYVPSDEGQTTLTTPLNDGGTDIVVAANGYWNVITAPTSGTYDYYLSAEMSNNVVDPADLRLVKGTDPAAPTLVGTHQTASTINGVLYAQRTAIPNGDRTGQFRLASTSLDAEIALPVELLFIDARLDERKSAVVTWATISELDNDYFEVERSLDGAKTFKAIAQVNGNGTVNERIDYRYVDSDIPTANQVIYYRLRQVDFDGQFEYSPVVALRRDFGSEFDGERWAIYPNPTNGSDLKVVLLNADLSGDDFSFRLVDMTGKSLYQKQVSVEQASQDLQGVVSNLKSGIYIVEITNGKLVDRFRIIKQ